jgi:hypothetical protein
MFDSNLVENDFIYQIGGSIIPYSWTVLCQDSSLKVLYIHSYTDLCNTKTGPLVAASKDVICTTTMRRGCHHETEGSVPWRNSASCTRRPRNRDSLISSPPPWPGSWPWGVAAIVPGQSARAAGRHPAHHHLSSLFGWLVADGWCWFVLREEYCWLVAAGCWWLVRSEKKVLLAGG